MTNLAALGEVLGTIWNGWHSAGLGAVLCSGAMETASGMGEGRCLTWTRDHVCRFLPSLVVYSFGVLNDV